MVWNLGEDDYIGHPPRSKSGGWKFSPKCALRVKMFNFDAVKCLKMVKIAHMWMAVFYQIRWIKNIDQLVRGKHVFLGIWKFITPKFVSVFPFIISNRPTFSEGRGVQTSLGIQICPSPPLMYFWTLLNLPTFWDFFSSKKNENYAFEKKLRPIDLPKWRFEKGSFIYQRGENGTVFRGTSQVSSFHPGRVPLKPSAYKWRTPKSLVQTNGQCCCQIINYKVANSVISNPMFNCQSNVQ